MPSSGSCTDAALQSLPSNPRPNLLVAGVLSFIPVGVRHSLYASRNDASVPGHCPLGEDQHSPFSHGTFPLLVTWRLYNTFPSSLISPPAPESTHTVFLCALEDVPPATLVSRISSAITQDPGPRETREQPSAHCDWVHFLAL